MKGTKAVFLFLALLLPVLVFLFLKMFGKNEFAVQSLYQIKPPIVMAGCAQPTLPYHIPDSVTQQIPFKGDSLVLLWLSASEQHKKARVKVTEKYAPLNQMDLVQLPQALKWRDCIFFMKSSEDIILLNQKGFIRGVYASSNRDEMDRLFVELDIILKRY